MSAPRRRSHGTSAHHVVGAAREVLIAVPRPHWCRQHCAKVQTQRMKCLLKVLKLDKYVGRKR